MKGEVVSMPALQESHAEQDVHRSRLDIQVHDLLMKSPASRPSLVPKPSSQPQTFPEPVFPQHPELLAADDNYEEN